MIKKIRFALFVGLLFVIPFSTVAQEAEEIEEIQDEEISAEELEVEEPSIRSWFNGFIRDVRILITRDSIKKSELQLKKASAQIIRLRQIAKSDLNNEAVQKRLEKSQEKYGNLIDKINNRVEEFKENNADSPQLKNFLDKYTNHQLKHQEILKRIEENVPEKAMEIIRRNRELHLERFGEVMGKLQDKEEIKQSLKENLDERKEEIKSRIRRMEIIEELGEKATSTIKDQVREIEEERKELFQELKIKREEIEQEGKS